jgi:hypothetical protein
MALLVFVSGCSTLQQIAALSQVEFTLDRVSGLRLAGVPLDGIDSPSAVSAAQIARIAAALVSGDVPLDLVLHVRALNPESNAVEARLVGLDWTLLIEERETISGDLRSPVVLPPGEPRDVPLGMRLNLADFVEGGARDLLDLALSLAGAGGEPRNVALRATPTVDTPLGPIRYPRPLTIRGSVGS